MDLNKLVRAAIFTALAIGAGYALVMIPNVELITVIIFSAGLSLGVKWGLLIGATAEMIFSGLNPMGSGLVFPPLYLAQITGMMIVGLAGGLFRPLLLNGAMNIIKMILLGITGFLLTFIFDSLTTLSYPLSAGFDASRTLGLYMSGIAFTILHQVSNAVIFATGIPRIVRFLNS